MPLCTYYRTGTCRRSSCTFQHIDCRNGDSCDNKDCKNGHSGNWLYVEPCTFFLLGCCTKDDCWFAHIQWRYSGGGQGHGRIGDPGESDAYSLGMTEWEIYTKAQNKQIEEEFQEYLAVGRDIQRSFDLEDTDYKVVFSQQLYYQKNTVYNTKRRMNRLVIGHGGVVATLHLPEIFSFADCQRIANACLKKHERELLIDLKTVQYDAASKCLSVRCHSGEQLLKNNLHAAFFSHFPSHWTVDVSFSLIDVGKNSPEWNSVLANWRYHETMRQHPVVKMQRVQNNDLWQRFMTTLLSKVNRGNIKRLWYGTRDTPPITIATSGIDFRESSDGLYGKGAYFAQDASYSFGYRHNLPDGNSAQFFACRVELGKVEKPRSNRNLMKPPNDGDSVQGTSNGSVIHVVYENAQAYPEYLITFGIHRT